MEATQVSTTHAESLVAGIFSRIGVNLIWHNRLSDCDGLAGESVQPAFKIGWAEYVPPRSPAGTLAAAHPFGSPENSITIYRFQLERFVSRYGNAPDVVLAYVLAHELAHVMQGLDYHAGSGILKANWSFREYYLMLSRSLTFTARDVDLIHAGLQAKRSGIATREDAPQDRSTSAPASAESSAMN